MKLLDHVRSNGEFKEDRTKINTLSTFGYQMRFDLRRGFPIVTTKKIHLRSVVFELLWFLKGETNVKTLQENGVRIWNEWADKNGNLGPIYGYQWVSWPAYDGNSINQIAKVIDEIHCDKNSRRLIVSAWNVAQLESMALPPCHLLFQFYVIDNLLSCQVYQRSADIFLGVPFNITSYALLTCLVAHVCDLVPKELIWTGGDCHIYLNHLNQVKEQLKRKPYPLAQLEIRRKPRTIFEFCYDDIIFHNYQFHPILKGKIAV